MRTQEEGPIDQSQSKDLLHPSSLTRTMRKRQLKLLNQTIQNGMEACITWCRCADVSDHLNILNVYGLGPQWLVSKNILNYFLTMTCSDPAPETCQC